MPYKDLNIRREKAKEYTRRWRSKNREKYLEQHRLNARKPSNRDKQKQAEIRKMKNPAYKLKIRIKERIRSYIRKGKMNKISKITLLNSYLGCTWEELKVYLEAKFKQGMSWENHGKVWELDHIKPLCSFNLLEESEQKIAFHYSNLQPLTVLENRSKSGKLEVPTT